MKGNRRVKEPIIEWIPKEYRACYAAGDPGKLDGDIRKPFWSRGAWTDDFHDIEGDFRPMPRKRTRAKVLWNEEALWIACELEEDRAWATVTQRDQLIYTDNDFEVFLAPQDTSHLYYELEMNALGTVWDLLMERPQRDCVRRIIGWDIHGLECAVKVDGALNDPKTGSRCWTAEMKLPWFSLRECGKDECYPTHFAPDTGEVWRMNFSRVEYDTVINGGKYEKARDEDGREKPEHNWVWAPTGVIDIHMPEMWGYLVFTRDGEEHPLPLEEDRQKLKLRRLYYREHARCVKDGCFTEDIASLGAGLEGVKVYTTPSMFEGVLEWNGRTFHIRDDGYLWEGERY